jgi:hypothetical protein
MNELRPTNSTPTPRRHRQPFDANDLALHLLSQVGPDPDVDGALKQYKEDGPGCAQTGRDKVGHAEHRQ